MKYVFRVVCLFVTLLGSSAQAGDFSTQVNGPLLLSQATTEAAPPAPVPAVAVTQKNEDPTSREIREDSKYAINISVAPVHVPFPMAWGINANYVASEKWIWGLDYQASSRAIKFLSYELGEVRERSLALQARYFVGNSFNWKMGVGQRRTELKLPGSYFDLATHDYSMTVTDLRSNFIRLGFGNQWQFKKKFTFVVDWLTLNLPFSGDVVSSASQYASSPSTKQDIENAENILKYYPSGSTLQFQLGMMF